MTNTQRRMRSKNVALALTTLAAATALTSCSAGDDYQAICVDPETQVRVDDDDCDDVPEDAYYEDGSSGIYPAYWLFIPNGSSAPAVGSRYSGSSAVWKPPSGKTFSKGGFSSKGGVVKSGGFGSGFGKASS